MSEVVSMTERVARVIEPQAWRALGLADTLAYRNRRVSSLRKAREVLEEMRAPTDAMVDALNEHAGSIAPELAYGDAIQTAINEQVSS